MRNKKEQSAYVSFCAMKQRCNDPNFMGYANYGGRGIKVCARWRHSFKAFFEDMGPRPFKMSLDRIDTNGDYEPSNCRWATASEQARNSRRKRLIEIDGVSYPVAELAEKHGINMRTISVRHERGYSLEQILSKTKLHGTYNRTKTHCKRGHEFTPENTHVWNWHRTCLTCRREFEKRHYKRINEK